MPTSAGLGASFGSGEPAPFFNFPAGASTIWMFRPLGAYLPTDTERYAAFEVKLPLAANRHVFRPALAQLPADPVRRAKSDGGFQ